MSLEHRLLEMNSIVGLFAVNDRIIYWNRIIHCTSNDFNNCFWGMAGNGCCTRGIVWGNDELISVAKSTSWTSDSNVFSSPLSPFSLETTKGSATFLFSISIQKVVGQHPPPIHDINNDLTEIINFEYYSQLFPPPSGQWRFWVSWSIWLVII